MNSKIYPIGVQNFESLRKDDYFYIDKTALVYQLARTGRYYFLSRPRRFGKSLLISTLEAYFQGKKELFEGLAIERKYYETNKELIHDIGTAYQEVIRQFYEAGCRNLQLDDCTWGAIVGDAAKQRYKLLGTDIEDVKKELLEVNNLALEGKPEDMVITSHICRGNYHSTFFTSGPYDSVADYVFAKENVDALFLEYDDARSGGFAPLAKVSPDKKVVLGLITTKTPQLEEKEVVIKRIHEATKYIPLDRLYLSPQCGFASCEIGNKLTEEEQWAKLKLVKEIAEEVWGE